MEISPDAEDLAVKLVSEQAEHLRREAERIANQAKADRISTTYVEQAAISQGVRPRSRSRSSLLSSGGLSVSGLSIGITAGVLLGGGDDPAAGLISAVVVGVVGLGLLVAGAVRPD